MVTKEDHTPHNGTARAAGYGVKDTIPDAIKPDGTRGHAVEPPQVDAAKSKPDASGGEPEPAKKKFDPARYGSITIPPEVMLAPVVGPREAVSPEHFRALIAGEEVEGGASTAPAENVPAAGAQGSKKATELPTLKLPRVLAAELRQRRRRLAIGVAGVAFVLLGFTWWAVSRGQQRAPDIVVPQADAPRAPTSVPTSAAAEPKGATRATHSVEPQLAEPAPVPSAPPIATSAQPSKISDGPASDTSIRSKLRPPSRPVSPPTRVAPQPKPPAITSALIEPTVAKPKNSDPESALDAPLIPNPKRKSSDE